ncbi:DNA polymerase IV [Paraconexibacter antarcticus]|uniref:DNA polymerase IV n=1 Tax=Paraconexibacter antarcticus TaxID=2949664 RepID=A0ABY5DQK8_9ACTN|nr:DNA polymerase IV [Paraconexibacter antarcticus]UTI62859.1 DNA polymerase IV [Paraconexibacter antarcticus]
MPTVIAHLDIDAFYASVELLRRPELRGRPVIVSGDGPRAVVTTASYEARKFGVGSAMPTRRALRLCPDAVLIPPDFGAYRAASEVVMRLVRGTVDEVEVMGLDEAYLDLGGLLSPRAAMRRLVTEIRAATGLDASVGIGPNKLIAKVASDAEKPRGFVVLTREQACARFAGHPPRLVPGIGGKTAERLEVLGITTLAALAAADPGLLAEHFGPRQGPWLVARGRFEGEESLQAVREAVSESRESTFDVDIAGPAELDAQLQRLADQLCRGLQKHDRTGRTIAIKVRLDDWTTVTRARTIAHPTNAVEHVGQIAAELLREYAPPRPVRLLGVRVASFGGVEEPPAQTAQLALPV